MGRIVGLVIDPAASADGYGIPTNSDLAPTDGVRGASESYETPEGSVVPLEGVYEPVAVPGRSRPKGKG